MLADDALGPLAAGLGEERLLLLAPLDLAVAVPNVALGGRIFGVKVLSLRFVPA